MNKKTVSDLNKQMIAVKSLVSALKPLSKIEQIRVLNAVYVKCFPKELEQLDFEFEVKKLQSFQSAVKNAFGSVGL